MSQKLQPIRGTKDVWGDEFRQQRLIVAMASAIIERFGYHPMQTPIFEKSEVFLRTLGEASDVVNKETYTFLDRDKTSITLRPELTASMMRAMLSNSLTQNLPQKFYAIGPVFRHERPQESRYRQFQQIDCEYFGGKHPLVDVEVITLAKDLLVALGLMECVSLEINSLGDAQSRQHFNEELIAFLQNNRQQLSPDSQRRLLTNPLRILDSKDQGDRQIIAQAPSILDYLNESSSSHWQEVLRGLDFMGIPYRINHHLVRGLDYYSHTVFEFTTTAIGENGTSITVLAGGRFDKLAEAMGGPPLPSVGFAAGLERLWKLRQSLLMKSPRPILFYLLPIVEQATLPMMELAGKLRESEVAVMQDFDLNITKGLKRAHRANATFTIIIGEDELRTRMFKFKAMDTGTEVMVGFDQVHLITEGISIFKP